MEANKERNPGQCRKRKPMRTSAKIDALRFTISPKVGIGLGVGVLFLSGLGLSCTGGGIPNSQSVPAIDLAVAPRGEVPGLFAADDVWLVGSDVFLAGGFGNALEFAVLFVGRAGQNLCRDPLDPPSNLTFDGGTLSLKAVFDDTEDQVLCGIEFSGGVESCFQPTIDPGAPCLLTGPDGRVVRGQSESLIGEPQLIRLERCPGPLTSLPEGEWILSNIHPFSATFLDQPGRLEAVIVVQGEGAEIESANFIAQVEGASPVGCVNEVPNGPLEFDEARISLQMSFGNADVGSADCSIEFEGTTTYCAILDSATLGPASTVGQYIRFDGVGRFSGAGKRSTMNTMYLSQASSGDSANGPGIRR